MKESEIFEDAVRQIARALWPSAQFSGSAMISGRERDGVFETEDCVHLVECTIEPKKEKAVKDALKISEAATLLRSKHPDKAIKGWFITKKEPTAEQRHACASYGNLINCCSINTFRAKIIDAESYLESRSHHKFGSITSPISTTKSDDIRYVSIDMFSPSNGKYLSSEALSNDLLHGRRFTLLGDYGVGKSMTLREAFRFLKHKYLTGSVQTFPIYLNLREHQGQVNPAEILLRHAESIGFSGHHQLIRAWRSGYCTLLIDGFDEVSSLGLQGGERKLKQVRYASMAGVRRLIDESPPETGIALAGRDSFFSNDTERIESTGTQGFIDLKLNEFTEAQVVNYLEGLGISSRIPEWVPRRPLLLGSIIGRCFDAENAPERVSELLDILDPAEGWDSLIDDICLRESKIEAGLSGSTVRLILEQLATKARSTVTGLGPISRQDMVEAFEGVCGYHPADMALTVLQRLSGLCVDTDRDDDSRRFVDSDFADACRAADLISFITNPLDSALRSRLSPAQIAIGAIGLGITARKIGSENSEKLVATALNALAKQSDAPQAVAFDIIALAEQQDIPIRTNTIIDGLEIKKFTVSPDFPERNKISFTNCLIDQLVVETGCLDPYFPYFDSCIFGDVVGRLSKDDLPTDHFIKCSFGDFPIGSATNESLAGSDLSPHLKVILTILRKLYLQAGGGRQENAFFRGLPPQLSACVPAALEVVRKFDFAKLSDRGGSRIWLPHRSKTNEALQIINSPHTGNHPMVQAAVDLA